MKQRFGQSFFGRYFFLVEIFLWQNHSLGNSLDGKNLNENLFSRKFFIVAK
jgi:hypothetical protein